MRKISVLLSERDDARFCDYCKVNGHKKSTLIAHLIKEHLDRERFASTAQPSMLGAKRSRALRATRQFHGGAR